MNRHHPYQNIIERKLEQLPPGDPDLLWDEMNSILDKRMPQKKERRRFIMWILSIDGLLLLSLGLLVIISTTILFLSGKENAIVTVKKTPVSSASEKRTEDVTAKLSKEHKEIITNKNGSNPERRKFITAIATSPSSNEVVYESDDNFETGKTINGSEKSKTAEKVDQLTPGIPYDKENSSIATTELKQVQQDFPVKTKDSEVKESLSKLSEPGINKDEPSINKAKPNRRKNHENEFYGGIVSGIDLSSIHFRSVKQGVTKGLIVGYAFNKKWSIESGMLWDTKRVYDDGSYFSPPGYRPTNGIKITAVNGKSRLSEWPVNIKYTILSGKNSLFTTAGVSSYFMRSENYDYVYTQNNQPGGHNYLSYTNQTKNWFSMVNFSIGYSRKLGDFGNLRVEPYIKLPVKNIGLGKMPIMSSGLNIGFTKTLR